MDMSSNGLYKYERQTDLQTTYTKVTEMCVERHILIASRSQHDSFRANNSKSRPSTVV